MRKLALLSLCLALPALSQALGDPPVGKPAPAFSVQGQDGKTYSLAKLKGHPVVLEWMSPGCPFSQAQYEGNTQGLEKAYTAKGVIWLSVDSNAEGKEGYLATATDAAAFLKDKGAAPTALVRDTDGALGQLYGAKTTPHLFVIDAKGRLAYKGAMDDKPSTDAAEIAKSKNYVAAALDALLAKQAVAVPETRSYGCSVKYAH
jgi:peroxiredoxin